MHRPASRPSRKSSPGNSHSTRSRAVDRSGGLRIVCQDLGNFGTHEVRRVAEFGVIYETEARRVGHTGLMLIP